MRKFYLSLLFSSTFLSYGAQANEKQAQQPLPLESISVVATKSPHDSFDIPSMVSVVKSDDPSIQNAASLKQLLQNVPGVDFSGSARRNGQDITLRGYDSDGIVILIDGVRQRFESTHDGKFFVDPTLLKKVEVVKGPYSTLYGSGGLGGVISFETKDAADLISKDKNEGAITSIGYQSVNKEAMISQTGFGVYDKFDVLGQITYRNSDDVKLGDGGKLESDDEVANALFKLGYNIDAFSKVKLSVQGYQNNTIEPNNPQSGLGDVANEALTDKNTRSYTNNISYHYDNPDNPLLKLNLKLYHTQNEVEETILVDTNNNDVGDVTRRRHENIGFAVDNQSSFGKDSDVANIFTYGIEFFEEKMTSKDSANGVVGGIPNASAQFFGAFIQDEITLKSDHIPGQFYVVPGVRIDDYQSNNAQGATQDEKAVSPKVGLTYRPNDTLMLFSNYARGFRAPDLGEIYAQGVHFTIPGIGINTFQPNTDLKPEKNESVEFGFGLKFKDVITNKDQFRLKASYYEIDSTNFIDSEVIGFVPRGPFVSAGNTISQNIDSASLHGNEIEIGYENQDIRFDFSYNYLTGKNDNTKEYLTNITPKTYKSHIGFKLPTLASVVGLRSTFVQKHKNVNDADEIRNGFATHDLYWQVKPTKDLTVNVGIGNLFDKKVVRVFAGSPEPGRNFKTNITYKW